MRILITGGSSEIAQALAARRAREFGDEIVVTASSAQSLAAMLENYRKQGVSVQGFVLDLYAPGGAEAELQDWLQRGVDAVILNAATPSLSLRLFHELPAEKVSAFLSANIEGNLWLLRRVLGAMKEKRFGRLVFISSVSAAAGTSRYGSYCLTKAALEGFFLNIAVDYGVHGITANILRPGIIATSRTRRFWKREAYMKKVSALIPMGTLGTAAQVAEAADPMLSATSYLNGATLTVSGGLPLFRSDGALSG